MVFKNQARRVLSIWLSAAIIWLGLFSSVSQAGMISTSQMQSQQQASMDRQQILTLLDRAEVQQQLIGMGVDIDAAKDRVSQLTANELSQLNAQMGELPAGGNILGLLVLIFLVFVITDVIGATDIFPFIKSVNN